MTEVRHSILQPFSAQRNELTRPAAICKRKSLMHTEVLLNVPSDIVAAVDFASTFLVLTIRTGWREYPQVVLCSQLDEFSIETRSSCSAAVLVSALPRTLDGSHG